MSPLPIILALVASVVADKWKLEHQWNYVEFDCEQNDHKQAAVNCGLCDRKKIFMWDMEPSKDGRLFVTTPRSKGVPVSLSTVSQKTGPGGKLLTPFPDWSWHGGDCNNLTNVYRIKIDKCGRLWVVDTGTIETRKSGHRTTHKRVCPPQLLVFNLFNDKLVKRIKIPMHLVDYERHQGRVSSIAVETEGPKCERTWVYLGDSTMQGGLFVYDGKDFWRLDGRSFGGERNASRITVADERIYFPRGIEAMDVRPADVENRDLYFNSFSSFNMYRTCLDGLHKSREIPELVTIYKSHYALPSQSGSFAISRDGILFFALTEQSSIGCWNSRHPRMDETNVDIVGKSKRKFQFVSSMKALCCANELWLMSNRYQKFTKGTMNLDEINFRIFKAPIDSLIEGTGCELPHQ